jgi:hypothetical protein
MDSSGGRKSSRQSNHAITRNQINPSFAPPTQVASSSTKNKRKPIARVEADSEAIAPVSMESTFAPPSNVEEPITAVAATSNKKKKRKAMISDAAEPHLTASFLPPVDTKPVSSSRKSKRRDTAANENQGQAVEMQLMTASYVAPIAFEARNSPNTETGNGDIDYAPYDTYNPGAATPPSKTHSEDDKPIDYAPYEAPDSKQRPRKSSMAANLAILDSSDKRSTGMLIETYRPEASQPNDAIDMESTFRPPEENSMDSSFKPPKKLKRKAVLVDATRSDK